jgi:hypothetical protein
MGVLAVLLTTGVAAGGAFGASSKPWQVEVGKFKTTSAASAEITKLNGKGFSGYSRETDKGKAKYEVEKGFTTKKKADTAMSKLHKAGFKGAAVENEKSEKTSG